jgi:hypothetical protein
MGRTRLLRKTLITPVYFLQTSDTVIIYDPDPNPKNEEQAIARSHRIGQKRDVLVFHFESVADKGIAFERRADGTFKQVTTLHSKGYNTLFYQIKFLFVI